MAQNYEIIGLQNYVSYKLRHSLSEVAEKRYDDYILANIEQITKKTNDKIIEKLSDMIADDFISGIRQLITEETTNAN